MCWCFFAATLPSSPSWKGAAELMLYHTITILSHHAVLGVYGVFRSRLIYFGPMYLQSGIPGTYSWYVLTEYEVSPRKSAITTWCTLKLNCIQMGILKTCHVCSADVSSRLFHLREQFYFLPQEVLACWHGILACVRALLWLFFFFALWWRGSFESNKVRLCGALAPSKWHANENFVYSWLPDCFRCFDHM